MAAKLEQIGKYRLARLVGQGGMGSVYIAEDTVLGRRVAVKVLHQHLTSSDSMRDRFRNEAVTQARLQHPSIVTLYDFITEGDISGIVMEYVPGGRNLGDLIRRGPLGQRPACDVLRQVLRGVAYAHERKVIHRDIKPGNILLGEELGRLRPKLTDFGIAKLLHGTSYTQPGSVLGTADYMSPEQCMGRSDLGPTSDIYSLGVVFYECLTGRVPFADASDFGVMQKHVNEPPDPPSSFVPDLLPGVVALCMRALEKDASLRCPSAPAMLEELDALAAELDGVADAPLVLPPPRVSEEEEAFGASVPPAEPKAGPPTAVADVPPVLHDSPTLLATAERIIPLTGSAIPPAAVSRPATSAARAATSAARAATAEADPGKGTGATTTVSAAAAEAATGPKPRSRGKILALLVLVLLAAAAGGVLLFLQNPPAGEPGAEAGGGPAVPAATAADPVEGLLADGRFGLAADEVLARLAKEPTSADAERLAAVLEGGAASLTPDQRRQAAQALERWLRAASGGPEAEARGAAAVGARAAKALAEAGDLGGAVLPAAVVVEMPVELAAADSLLAALAGGVEASADFAAAREAVRLLSSIPPGSALYEGARRALDLASPALRTRQTREVDDALRSGRWADAVDALERLTQELGDTGESQRLLLRKAKELAGYVPAGLCRPAGLARVRDPNVPSRYVGRPQLAWTGKEYVVVWSDARSAPENSAAQQVFLQRLDASGARLLETDKPLSQVGVDANRVAIDFAQGHCGIAWDEFTGTKRQVVLQVVDFLGNPVSAPTLVDEAPSTAASPTVAAVAAGDLPTFAVAWTGRDPEADVRSGPREAVQIAFFDHQGTRLDGPRLLRLPDEPVEGAPRRRAPTKPPVTRLAHVVGLGPQGFAVGWEEEGRGRVVVGLAAFGLQGGEPAWMLPVVPEPGTSTGLLEGRIPLLAADPAAGRLAVLWIDRRPALDKLYVTLYGFDGQFASNSVGALGLMRYHGAAFVGDDLIFSWWVGGRTARLGLLPCPAGVCPPPAPDGNSIGDLPAARLGGRVGLAPGPVAREFAAVWRERPGATVTGEDGGEEEEPGASGDEIFFVRFRCGGS